jgi:hypothetical protein
MFADFSPNPIDWVTGVAGDVVSSAASGFFDALGSWVDDGLHWVAQQVAVVMVDLSAPKVGSAAFTQMAGWFKWLALATTVVTIIGSAGGAMIVRRAEITEVAAEIPKTLLLLVGWYGAVAVWFELTRALTAAFTGDALAGALSSGLTLDAGIVSFPRLFIAFFMTVFLFVFLIEMVMLQHIVAMAAIIGPLSIALRPWPGLRDVSAKMVRNLAMTSLTPALTAGSMSLAVHNMDSASPLGFVQALGALGGMLISVLMPFLIHKFFPIGGPGDSGARALIAGGAAAAGVAATVASGGALAPVAGSASRLGSLVGRGGGEQ